MQKRNILDCETVESTKESLMDIFGISMNELDEKIREFEFIDWDSEFCSFGELKNVFRNINYDFLIAGFHCSRLPKRFAIKSFKEQRIKNSREKFEMIKSIVNDLIPNSDLAEDFNKIDEFGDLSDSVAQYKHKNEANSFCGFILNPSLHENLHFLISGPEFIKNVSPTHYSDFSKISEPFILKFVFESSNNDVKNRYLLHAIKYLCEGGFDRNSSIKISNNDICKNIWIKFEDEKIFYQK